MTTEHPVVSPKIAVVKSSDPVSVVAGQDIKYTLSFSNTGNGAGEWRTSMICVRLWTRVH
ncbi:hypothetical protein ACETU7_22480 [Rhodococcus sp. 3Y1]